MRMFLTRRWLLFAVGVAVLALACLRLGEWQFHRLDERKARNAVTERNLRADPAPVGRVLAVGRPVRDADEWRRVTATGSYRDRETVTIRYQTRDGHAGVDVVTPLVTASGAAVLVDRGWVATSNAGVTDADVPAAPTGPVRVTGWVRADATGDAATVTDRSARAVSSRNIAPTLATPAYGGWLDARSEQPPPSHPPARAEPPDLSNGPHFFYGLQWWFFAALAVFGFFYLARDERRKTGARRDRAGSGPDTSTGSVPGTPSDAGPRNSSPASQRTEHATVDREHRAGHK